MTPPGQIFSARDVAARGTRDFTPLPLFTLFPPALELDTSLLLFTGHDSTPQTEPFLRVYSLNVKHTCAQALTAMKFILPTYDSIIVMITVQ